MSVTRRIRVVLEVLRALATMTLIELSLRTGDLPTTCRTLRVGCDLHSATPPARQHAVLPRNTRAAVVAAQFVLARWPAGDTCLRRCLLIGHRLHRLEPVLRIGVKRGRGGEFSAHSWLEIQGRTLDPAAAEYATLGSARR